MYSGYYMPWKEYLQERLDATPTLANEQTQNSAGEKLIERPVVLRLMSFAGAFVNGVGDSRFIVMYGLRGIGKSTAVFQVYNRLRNGNFFNKIEESRKIPKSKPKPIVLQGERRRTCY